MARTRKKTTPSSSDLILKEFKSISSSLREINKRQQKYDRLVVAMLIIAREQKVKSDLLLPDKKKMYINEAIKIMLG